jgi:hypothetical protein
MCVHEDATSLTMILGTNTQNTRKDRDRMASLSTITTALERSWTAIRTVYPDVRQAALVVYLHPNGDRKGHYWQNSWTLLRDNTQIDEVHISSHLFALDAVCVFQTLIHEAVHSCAVTRGIQDTSRQGRWHNKAFASIATEFGLVVESDSAIGHVTTDITTETRKKFANAIGELQQAIEMYQAIHLGGKGKGKGKSRGMVKLVCPSCGRVIRASIKTMDVGPILCVPCKDFFQEPLF